MRRVKLTSARKLSGATLDEIIERVRGRLGEDVEINIEINPDLIGGIVVQQDDIVFDGSIRHQLERIKRHLGR